MFRTIEKLFCIINKRVCDTHILKNYDINCRSVSKVCNTVEPRKIQEVLETPDDEPFKINKNVSIKLLQELLNMRPIVAKNFVTKHKKFQKISAHAIKENYSCYLENGVLQETLEKCPEILSELYVYYKIIELQRIPYDINVTYPLISLTYQRLQTFVNEEIRTNRIQHISKLLEVDETEVCQALARRTFLISLDINQLSANVKLLTENNITKSQIMKDLWVLRYSTNLIQERLDLAKNNNIEVFKTWMVRAQTEIFETYIRRRSDKKLILGNSSLTQYLSERLECTEEIAKYIISKHPVLQNKSLKKMNEILDYLFKYGFKPIHICRVPKILLHSVETTRKRLKELEAKGLSLDSLYILTKSQKQYMQYCESLIKTSKNKLKNM